MQSYSIERIYIFSDGIRRLPTKPRIRILIFLKRFQENIVTQAFQNCYVKGLNFGIFWGNFQERLILC